MGIDINHTLGLLTSSRVIAQCCFRFGVASPDGNVNVLVSQDCVTDNG